MAIAKRPGRNRAAAEAFISGAGSRKAAAAKVDDRRVPVVIRIPGDLLARVDKAAKARGISRAAWLCMVASKGIEGGE